MGFGPKTGAVDGIKLTRKGEAVAIFSLMFVVLVALSGGKGGGNKETAVVLDVIILPLSFLTISSYFGGG